MERVKLKVHGMVQGVFFRATTRNMAVKLGLDGFVRNTSDGCVEIVAIGARESLERLITWCRKGPAMARVDQLDVSWDKPDKKLEGFKIT